MAARRNILFVPFGSEGDVNPLLWLAGRLAARGHRPVFLLSPHYGQMAGQLGFDWHPVGTEEDFRRMARDPDLWKPGKGTWRVARAMHESLPAYREAFQAAGGSFDLAVVSSFGLAVSSLAEAAGIPRLMLHLQPMCVRSHGDMFVPQAGFGWFPGAPAPLQDALFFCVDALLNRTILPPLNSFRVGLELPRLRDFYREVLMGAEGLALMCPGWFAPPQPDWPPRLRAFDFPLGPLSACTIPEDLVSWLDAGEPPVLWTHGSANVHLARAQQLALDTMRVAGGRTLLVGTTPPERVLPEGTFYCRHVAFEAVFPRCRAVVHHGGIGTTSKAFAAGVPQLVIPLAHDQHDNAARVSRLGAGLQCGGSAREAARKLDLLSRSAEIREGVARCRLLAAHSPAKAEAVADWAEELAGSIP